MPVFGSDGPCPACNRHSDRYGDHALNCGYSGERISRHNLLRDAIFDVASAAALSPVKEGRFLLPGADRRPADVFIRGWAGGQDAALDVTVINPLQDLTRAGAAASPGHAADVAFQRKMGGAAEACRSEAGIDKSLALERKIESRKRNFSLDLKNLIFSISLPTLDFREWQQKILFPLSIFESGKKKFSFYSRFSRV